MTTQTELRNFFPVDITINDQYHNLHVEKEQNGDFLIKLSAIPFSYTVESVVTNGSEEYDKLNKACTILRIAMVVDCDKTKFLGIKTMKGQNKGSVTVKTPDPSTDDYKFIYLTRLFDNIDHTDVDDFENVVCSFPNLCSALRNCQAFQRGENDSTALLQLIRQKYPHLFDQMGKITPAGNNMIRKAIERASLPDVITKEVPKGKNKTTSSF